MKVADFIEAFRSDLVDSSEPPLWSDADIVRYLNDAVQEACERAKLIEDRRTPAVCSITLEPDVSTYSLHPSVFEIKRATLRGRPLDETSVEEMDEECPGWENWKGTPRLFIFEQASGTQPASIRMVRTPTQADTLALTVYRGALKPLSVDRCTEKPELPERFHERLKDWVYRCAYLKQDVDAMDKSKAAEYEVAFERSFGARPDANVQRKQRDRRPPIVAINW
ncbi:MULTISPECIES: hypothetical protein [unclassified Acidovorax]|uniref:phage adaptor protein n=1 Tax=unclassified Acidovorax TaxID=2684926 RepID=UPI001C46C6B6|nr:MULTISPECIES: hypothetical protein [unclassified Acidovorax]MBV7428055.1 hypothetical protein [Acidovorax sp. sif0732]MBV7449312.1 hypothetical protein [Acidovorax sp. sif0715]